MKKKVKCNKCRYILNDRECRKLPFTTKNGIPTSYMLCRDMNPYGDCKHYQKKINPATAIWQHVINIFRYLISSAWNFLKGKREKYY